MSSVKLERAGRRRGAAAIEFGFWLPIVFLMLSGIVDLSWYMSRSEIVMRAARDGARHGATRGLSNAEVSAGATTRANQVLATLGLGGCTVTPFVGPNPAGYRIVRTEVTCGFTPLIGALPLNLPTQINYSFLMFTELQP